MNNETVNKTEETINKIIELLHGLTASEAEQILHAAISSLPYRSCVQSVIIDQ